MEGHHYHCVAHVDLRKKRETFTTRRMMAEQCSLPGVLLVPYRPRTWTQHSRAHTRVSVGQAGWEWVEGRFLMWERPRVLTSDTAEPHRFVPQAGSCLSHRDYENRTQTLGLSESRRSRGQARQLSGMAHPSNPCLVSQGDALLLQFQRGPNFLQVSDHRSCVCINTYSPKLLTSSADKITSSHPCQPPPQLHSAAIGHLGSERS